MPNKKYTRPKLGAKYGRWTIISESPMRTKSDGKRVSQFVCRCDCGKTKEVMMATLVSGTSKSCGCLQADWIRENAKGGSPRLDPEVAALTQLLAQYKANAKLRDVMWLLSKSEFNALIKSDCYYCGAPPAHTRSLVRSVEFKRNGIDRVDGSDVYVDYNVVPCCWMCNQAKMDRNQAEFIQWVIRAADHLKNTGIAKV